MSWAITKKAINSDLTKPLDLLIGELDVKIDTISVVKSLQTGYVSGDMSNGSGEDDRFIDITISSVTASKCIIYFYGGSQGGSDSASILAKSGNTLTYLLTPRIFNSTTLRLSAHGDYARGRWTVIEYK